MKIVVLSVVSSEIPVRLWDGVCSPLCSDCMTLDMIWPPLMVYKVLTPMPYILTGL